MADASALLEYLLRTEYAAGIEDVLRDPTTETHIPALCDIEIAAGLRRSLLRQAISARRAAEATGDYLELPLATHGHRSLLPRILRLGVNLSAYDSTYVALAEQLGATLLTADQRLARATRASTDLSVIP